MFSVHVMHFTLFKDLNARRAKQKVLPLVLKDDQYDTSPNQRSNNYVRHVDATRLQVVATCTFYLSFTNANKNYCQVAGAVALYLLH